MYIDYVRFLFYILVYHNVNGIDECKWLPLGADLTLDYIEEKLMDKRTEPECVIPSGIKRLQIYYHAVSLNEPMPSSNASTNTNTAETVTSSTTASIPTQPIDTKQILSATESSQYTSSSSSNSTVTAASSIVPSTTSTTSSISYSVPATSTANSLSASSDSLSISASLLSDPILSQFAVSSNTSSSPSSDPNALVTSSTDTSSNLTSSLVEPAAVEADSAVPMQTDTMDAEPTVDVTA